MELASRYRRQAARYRPYLLVLVAVLLVTFLPSRRSGTSDPGAGAGAGARVGASISDGEGGVQSEALGPDAPTDPGSPTDVAGAATAATGAAPPPKPTGAGIGTPAALTAPDCDTKTGLLKISYIWRPPCVVPWPEGAVNGGATSMGVTARTIKVVWMLGAADSLYPSDSDEERLAKLQTSIDVYEHHYRMWGRKVELSIFHPTGTDEIAQRADAIALADMKPFAVLNTHGEVLEVELARRGIICSDTAQVREKLTLELAPYLWGPALQGPELLQLNIAEYVGRRLLGKPARWAGQTDYRVAPRKFGYIHPDTWDTKPFVDILAKHGGKVAVDLGYSEDPATYFERARVLAARMKSEGVTSVIAGTDFQFTGVFTEAATGQNWFPEWITTGFQAQDLDIFASTYNPAQWKNAFGVGAIPLGGTVGIRFPQVWFYEWHWGVDPIAEGHTDISAIQSNAVPLFDGIHGAGPNLTPFTFRDGNFARPPQGGAATGAVIAAQSSYGRWGFEPWDSYNAADDFSEIYWDATALGPDIVSGQQTAGHFRHLNGGKRTLYNQWPTSEPKFFDPAGTAHAGTYDSYPPNDTPPDFPCTGCPSERR